MYIQRLTAMLSKRQHDLNNLVLQKKAEISSLPEGRLSVSSKGCGRKGYNYYLTDGHGNRTYIRSNSTDLAKKLAQKEYDIKLVINAEKEMHLIDRYLNYISVNCPEDLYSNLAPARRAVVTPFISTDEDYIDQWKKLAYTGKTFSENEPEHYTERGLRVRSKSEEMIANTLDRMNIPYKYECPLILSGWGTIYPDFTVLQVKRRKEMIWDHFGMMDNADYSDKATKKISKYMADGYYPGDNLVLTFESSDMPISTRQITEICRRYFLE